MLKALKGKTKKDLQVSRTICGKLLKKSGNKYQLSMQERYVRIEGTFLRYYKHKSDTQENGSVDLSKSSWVRPFDSSPDCKTFEVQSTEEDRTFVFEATNATDRQIWVESIELVINDCRQQQTAAKAEKILNDTPPRIRLFDEEGEAVFRREILRDIESIYPPSNFSLREHIEAATDISYYLNDFVPEVQKSGLRPTRYDILVVALDIVNTVLTNRLSDILTPDHPYIAEAPVLGDLHKVIQFLTAYQSQMSTTICPVKLPGQSQPATYCEIIDRIPMICHRYVNGDAQGRGAVGAAALLVDSCHNVLSELLKTPVDMIQKHRDGSFFTNAPTEMWSTLHQHLELAMMTKSPILQVMIADKISIALKHIVGMITDFVKKLDTSSSKELKEVELELLSALTNDNAMHIEEIVAVVDNFTMEEIRYRVNEIFDDVTVNLIACGNTCLKRLTQVVMSDIEEQLHQVFTPAWIEGNQLQVAIATISDYFSDLETYLMSFWSEKLVSYMLEAIILRYTRSVIFRNEKRPERPKPQPIVKETITEIVKSSFFGFGKKVVEKVVQQVIIQPEVDPDFEITWCEADAECLGRIAQDVNTLNAFFSTRVGQEKAQDYLAIMNEVLLMLQLPIDRLGPHALSRISEFPSSAEAICDVAVACVEVREEDSFDPEELEELKMMMTPAIQVAEAAALQLEADGIAEGPLGLLFLDLVPSKNGASASASSSNNTAKSSLAQRLKDMANVPLAALKKVIDDEEEGTADAANGLSSSSGPIIDEEAHREALQQGKDSLLKESSNAQALVSDVLEVMQQQQLELLAIALEKEREEEERERERERIARGNISLEGHFDKKSPAHNLWQNRFFKLQTRVDNGKFIYTLMWFKKKGGSVIKSADVSGLKSICLIESNRQLSYNRNHQRVMLSSEVQQSEEAVPVETNIKDSFGAMSLDAIVHYSYAITLSDGKEHILRGSKVDKVIKWINAFAQASNLAYDVANKEWNRTAYMYLVKAKELKKQEEERALRAKIESAIASQTVDNPLLIRKMSPAPVVAAAEEEEEEEEESNSNNNAAIRSLESVDTEDNDEERRRRAGSGEEGDGEVDSKEDQEEAARARAVREMLRLKRSLDTNKIAFVRTSFTQANSNTNETNNNNNNNNDDDSSAGAGSDNDDMDSENEDNQLSLETDSEDHTSTAGDKLRTYSMDVTPIHSSPKDSPKGSYSPKYSNIMAHFANPPPQVAADSGNDDGNNDNNNNDIGKQVRDEPVTSAAAVAKEEEVHSVSMDISVTERGNNDSKGSSSGSANEQDSSNNDNSGSSSTQTSPASRKPPPKRSQIRRSVLMSQAENINNDSAAADPETTAPAVPASVPSPAVIDTELASSTSTEDAAKSPIGSRRRVPPPPPPTADRA